MKDRGKPKTIWGHVLISKATTNKKTAMNPSIQSSSQQKHTYTWANTSTKESAMQCNARHEFGKKFRPPANQVKFSPYSAVMESQQKSCCKLHRLSIAIWYRKTTSCTSPSMIIGISGFFVCARVYVFIFKLKLKLKLNLHVKASALDDDDFCGFTHTRDAHTKKPTPKQNQTKDSASRDG